MSQKIIFVASHQPPLKDGLYTLELSHGLNYGGNKELFRKTRTFAVSGERFTLSPSQVHKLFPPANTQGNYDNVLPHIVLKRRTLPWERTPGGTGGAASWLALFIFTNSPAPTTTTGTLADLYPSTTKDGGGQLPEGTYSYGCATPTGQYFLGYGQNSTDACVYMDIPQSQFAAYAPSLADLSWNAHGISKTNPGAPQEDYAAVVANRLPVPGETCVAHLVSLESLGDQLPQDDGSFSSTPNWETIRLVSLKKWTFKVSPLQASFADVLQGLNQGIDSDSEEYGDSQLRLPMRYFPAAAPVNPPTLPFDSSYTVLSAQENADESVWYRGPFMPSTVTPPEADSAWSSGLLPSNRASELEVQVAATPASDQSYAAAWQVGRLLALADKNFAMGQVTWKRDCRLRLNTLIGQATDKPVGSRAAYAEAMKVVLADATKIKAVLGDALTTKVGDTLFIPQNLVDWLANLTLLNGLPFQYLVADMKMLPVESLRFFNVCPRWLACLLDGAWSLERQPAKQWAFDTAYQPWKQLMDGSLQSSSTIPGGNAWPVSGALLNSHLVSGYWPGIQFFGTPQANLLRASRLGPTTVLLLFDQALTALNIQEPPEGVHAGFDLSGIGQLSKPLRYVDVDNVCYPTPPSGEAPTSGTEAPASYTLSTIPQRIPSVIQLDQLATAMIEKLGITANAAGFTGAEFALELVEGVASATFNLPQQSKS